MAFREVRVWRNELGGTFVDFHFPGGHRGYRPHGPSLRRLSYVADREARAGRMQLRPWLTTTAVGWVLSSEKAR